MNTLKTVGKQFNKLNSTRKINLLEKGFGFGSQSTSNKQMQFFKPSSKRAFIQTRLFSGVTESDPKSQSSPTENPEQQQKANANKSETSNKSNKQSNTNIKDQQPNQTTQKNQQTKTPNSTQSSQTQPPPAAVQYETYLNKVKELHEESEKLMQQGKFGEAEMNLINCSHILSNVSGQDALYNKIRTNLAYVYQNIGDYKSAESLYNSVLSNMPQTSTDPAQKIARAHILANLAEVIVHQRKCEPAKAYYEESLSIFNQLNEKTLAGALMGNWSIFLSLEEKYNEAKPLCENALQILVEDLGFKNDITDMCLQNLALIYNNLEIDVRQLQQKWNEQTSKLIEQYQQEAAAEAQQEEKIIELKKQELSQTIPRDLDPPGIMIEDLTSRQMKSFEKVHNDKYKGKFPWKADAQK